MMLKNSKKRLNLKINDFKPLTLQANSPLIRACIVVV